MIEEQGGPRRRSWAAIVVRLTIVGLVLVGCADGGLSETAPEDSVSVPVAVSPTTQPEVATAPSWPSTTPAASPKPTVFVPYPVGTRTGVMAVDDVLDLVDSHDAAALAQRVAFQQVACTDESGALPCPPGLAVGSVVGGLSEGACEQRFVLETDRGMAAQALEALASIDWQLLAVWREVRVPGLISDGDYGVAVWNPDRLVQVFYIDTAGGVTANYWGGGDWPPVQLSYVSAFLLDLK